MASATLRVFLLTKWAFYGTLDRRFKRQKDPVHSWLQICQRTITRLKTCNKKGGAEKESIAGFGSLPRPTRAASALSGARIPGAS